MASNLSIPNDVRETAAVIYRRAVKQNMIRGRSIDFPYESLFFHEISVDNPYALAILEKPSNEVSLKAVFL